MDNSDNGFSSSTSSKDSAIQKFSPNGGGADENALNNDQMASKLQNPKKPPTKHFMSPTMSAASKSATPRKKILAERNEASNFSDTHLDNIFVTLGIDSSDGSSSRLMPVSNRVSESDDDNDEQNTFVSDSSSKPYDPLRNYLSPRPKFLRYKPNRRREIFLGQENERRERKDGFGVKRRVSFDSQRKEDLSEDARSSSVSSSQDGSVKQEEDYDQINKKSDDSDEEIEEFEEEEDEKCLNLKAVLKFLLVFVCVFYSTLFISSMNTPTPSSTLQAIRGLKDRYDKIHNYTLEVVTVKKLEGKGTKMDDGFEEGLVESTDELGEVVEMKNGLSEDVRDTELDEAEEVPDAANGVEDVYDAELEKKEKDSVGFQQDETEESEYYVDDEHNPEKTTEGSHQLKGIGTAEIPEKCESFQDYQSLASNSENDANGWSSIKDETMEDEAKIETIQEISIEGAEKEVENSVEAIAEHSKKELISVTVIGIVLFFMIMATSVLGIHFRRKKTSVKQSLFIEKPLPKSVLAEKTSSVAPVLLPNVEEQHIEKVESFANPSRSIRSIEESSGKEFHQIRAPTVALIGELVVGCGTKSKMMEVEESNNSVSQEKGLLRGKAHAVSSQAQASVSEFSSMNSPSYGSFTAEKKIVRRREDGKDGEVRTALTTPVRRSSRIHNRAVLSP